MARCVRGRSITLRCSCCPSRCSSLASCTFSIVCVAGTLTNLYPKFQRTAHLAHHAGAEAGASGEGLQLLDPPPDSRPHARRTLQAVSSSSNGGAIAAGQLPGLLAVLRQELGSPASLKVWSGSDPCGTTLEPSTGAVIRPSPSAAAASPSSFSWWGLGCDAAGSLTRLALMNLGPAQQLSTVSSGEAGAAQTAMPGLPLSVSALTSLRMLQLSGNRLRGSLPPQ